MKIRCFDDNAALYQIIFNGEVIQDCCEADDELGYVIVYKKTKHGFYIIHDDKYVVEKIYGTVNFSLGEPYYGRPGNC